MQKRVTVRAILPTFTLALLLSACGDGGGPADTSTKVSSLAESGAGSLRQAIADAKAGDTIKFTTTGTVNLTTPITADKNLTIEANGVTFDAAGTGRVLEVPAGATVTLKGGTLTGGVGQGEELAAASLTTQAVTKATWGGNLINRGTLTLDGTTINNGSANNGGGIFNEKDATLTLKNVTMTGNKATIPTPDLENESTGSGGAIANRGTLVIESGTFSGNTAVYTGGAIRHTFGTLTINDGTFESNSCTNKACGGGGLFVAGTSTTTVNGGLFTGNNADGQGEGGGGAILQSVTTSKLTINGGNFRNNTSAYGGVIDVYKGGSLNITGGIFENNTASQHGGAIQLGQDTTDFQMSGGTIKGNTAAKNGGGINGDISMTFTGGTIEGNTAGDSGGGITLYVQAGKQNIVNISDAISIKNNSAAKRAGGIALYTNQASGTSLTVNMSGGRIEGNTAAEQGGGIYVSKAATLNISGGEVVNNTAAAGGGIATDGAVSMAGGFVNENKATAPNDGGGGIRMLDGGATLTITAGSISKNIAAHTGGGVLVGVNGTLTMSGGAIGFNSTEGAATSGGGGGLRLYAGSKTNLSGGTIVFNKSQFGGGIKSDENYQTTSASELTLSGANVQMRGNEATVSNGGGIYAGGKVTIQAGTVAGNTATQHGGGVFVRTVANFSQPGGSVSGNTPDNVFLEQ